MRLVTTTTSRSAADGNEPDQVYTDIAYHSIALFFNRDLSRDDEDPGLSNHDDLPANAPGPAEGIFKTPTLRNATKGENKITKAFMHNGYFKSIEHVVHFYNTRFDGTQLDTVIIRRTAPRPSVMISASRTQRPRKRSPTIAGPCRNFPK